MRAEYYFFCKQCDWYHRFRHSRTFWGTYLSLLLRNALNNLRRRHPGDCVRHPLQFSALVLASLLEQIGAWLLIPHFAAALTRDRSCYFHVYIDEERTDTLWRLPSGAALKSLRFAYGRVRSLFFPLFKKPVYDVRSVLRPMQRLTALETCSILLRVDDVFLKNNDAVDRFIDLMARKKFPFLAGIKGDDLRDPACGPVVERLRESGGEVGIHGFSHKGRFGPFASEIMQMKYPELAEKIAGVSAAEVFKRAPALAFMPPYNAIAGEQIAVLARRFAVITGGPETMRFSDRFAGPLALKDGGWYVPASHPYYTAARNLLHANALGQVHTMRGFICICLHMTEEAKDGYRALEKLLDALPTTPLSWRIFTKGQHGKEYFPGEQKEP